MTERPAPAQHVLAQVADGVGIITLNRPEKLNALTEEMVDAIGRTLTTWQDDDAVQIVALHGAGERGFCAGGDIKVFYESITQDRHGDFLRFLSREFEVDQQIALYPKPVVAFMDGLCMGGGVGLAAHAAVRIATPRSRIGMPEVRIGYSPDVGGTHLLGRAPGRMGEHLALTAAAMGAADAIDAGFADFCMQEDGLDQLLASLPDLMGLSSPEVASALEVLHGVAPPAATRTLTPGRTWIDVAYSGETVADILVVLDQTPVQAAREAAAEIRKHSPLSLETALQAVRAARDDAFLPSAFTRELRIAEFLMDHPDLPEGIRAQVIDKDRTPRWNPADVREIDREAVAAAIQPPG
ncbi:enoyl-CoA hydratase/isomerase family protein [Zhihengliuella sp.]|uniref:enoyl-CoA hydratase/isomerase family protein n=1 Tax=Zhihengliuella sp. TaxID=1954483 RepID=UPI00281204EE|nr:enoyl-CoA hydratase/isomerase family protein [Zhihengliuella sp.]